MMPEPVTADRPTRPRTTWRALCMNHDPALVCDEMYPDVDAGLEEIQDRRGSLGAQHEQCDLLLGTFVTPGAIITPIFVEVTCPPHPAETNPGEHQHDGPVSVDVRWLDLLVVNLPLHPMPYVTDASTVPAIRNLPACWHGERVRKLRPYLMAGRRG